MRSPREMRRRPELSPGGAAGPCYPVYRHRHDHVVLIVYNYWSVTPGLEGVAISSVKRASAETIPITDRFRTFLSIDNSLALDYMYRKMYTYN